MYMYIATLYYGMYMLCAYMYMVCTIYIYILASSSTKDLWYMFMHNVFEMILYCLCVAYLKGLPLPRLPALTVFDKEKGEERQVGVREVGERDGGSEKIRLEKSNILLLGPTGSGI